MRPKHCAMGRCVRNTFFLPWFATTTISAQQHTVGYQHASGKLGSCDWQPLGQLEGGDFNLGFNYFDARVALNHGVGPRGEYVAGMAWACLQRRQGVYGRLSADLRQGSLSRQRECSVSR